MEKKKEGTDPRITAEELWKLPKPSDFKQPGAKLLDSWILKPSQQRSLLQFHTCRAAAVQPFREHSEQNSCSTAGVYSFTGHKWIQTSLRPSTQRAHKAKLIRKAALITPYILGTFQPSVPLYNPSSTKKKLKSLFCFNGMTASGLILLCQVRSFQPLRAVTSQTLLTFMVVVLNSDDSALGCSCTFKYCLLIQGLYSEGINHTDVDFFCINKWKLFTTMNCNMQDNASGRGNGCDLLDHFENCPHELPGTCAYGSSTTEPSQA